MRLIITGSEGQLGRSLCKYIPNIFKKPNELFYFNKSEFNLLDTKECISKINQIKPNWLINCGAYTDVDKAEIEPDKSIFVNGYSIEVISKALKKNNGNLIQLSSDYVFDGEQSKPFKINHERNPINQYGLGKSLGEKFVEEILFPINNSKIIRTSWLMSSFGNNFASKIFKLHQSSSELKVIYDQVGSFTSATTLAKFIWEIILQEEQGIKLPKILHCTNSGVCSWYDIAIAIGEFLERNSLNYKKVKVLPISTNNYNQTAKRPSYSVLDCSGTSNLLPKKDIYWRDSLQNIIRELMNKNF